MSNLFFPGERRPLLHYVDASQTSTCHEPASNDRDRLRRDLSTRQVQMIAIGGTIGTGLFLGTGRALSEGGPASILICYSVIGFIVYVTLLLLSELGTQYPVSGAFTTYCARFFSPSFAFALSWNYWLNDAVSVATDLTAAQLVLNFWTDKYPWLISLLFLLVLLSANATHVRAYGEMEYILSSLKVLTIVAFIIVGVLVNAGMNRSYEPIGFSNWRIPGSPFVNGVAGFARVFVTASFAYGGTESLGITAGETRNPTKNMPRVVRAVFWRILLFYVLSIFIIGLNVPYTYPNLSDRSTTTSPFTIVFYEVGSNVASSLVNTIILSSALSAGNHALFAGTRILYSLASSNPRLAPAIFAHTSKSGVPHRALFGTASLSALCFVSSYVGSGVLWSWLQNMVGVSNQIAWLSIGLASWRFRKAWITQGRPLEEMKFRASWTWPWGPPFVVISVSLLILYQGWTSVFPVIKPIEFIAYYIQVPTMCLMTIGYFVLRGRHGIQPGARSALDTIDISPCRGQAPGTAEFTDLVDIKTVDLYSDEYTDSSQDAEEDVMRSSHLNGRYSLLWRLWYTFA